MIDTVIFVLFVVPLAAYVVSGVIVISQDLVGKKMMLLAPVWAFAVASQLVAFGLGSAQIAFGLVEPVGAAMGMGFAGIYSSICVGLPFLIAIALALVAGPNVNRMFTGLWCGGVVLALLTSGLLDLLDDKSAAVAACATGVLAGVVSVIWLVRVMRLD